MKLASINNENKCEGKNLQKIIEKNKFLSRIQEQKQVNNSNHNFKSPTFKNKDKIIKL